MSEPAVLALDRDAVIWPFHDQQPYVKIGGRRGHSIKVDPTPAYAHHPSLTERVVAQVQSAFPLDWPVTFYLLPHEEIGRTNGATYVDADWDGPKDDKGAFTGRLASIFFSAKRIPIHPAVTRYLVAHEYGHVVNEWLNERAGHQLYSDELLAEYAEMRGMEMLPAYGAGFWHATPGEVFANDFRIVVCGIETEYWPHPGIDHPDGLIRIRQWWAERQSGAHLEQDRKAAELIAA